MKDAHKRYLSFNEVLKEKFGQKIYRVSLNSGLSCPNIDGTKAKGGCYFCNDDYLLANSLHKTLPISQQLDYGISYLKERHKTDKFLAYFQNGTNTHASVNFLKPLFEEAIQKDKIVGLMISTRPDCLGDDILDLLSELNEKTYLWVENGLQSVNDSVLKKINRAHTFEDFAKATEKLADRNILNCVHMILGMPEETPQQILEGIPLLNALPINGIKIHNMFVTEFTPLAKWYRQGLYTPLTLNDYANLCVDYLERLRKDIVIHRLNAHAPKRLTVAPDWSVNKLQTLNTVHKVLVHRNTHQGKML